ncbi:MAG: endonuclease/exonuclease/phosphatase family protein [Anaerolineae bacterium]
MLSLLSKCEGIDRLLPRFRERPVHLALTLAAAGYALLFVAYRVSATVFAHQRAASLVPPAIPDVLSLVSTFEMVWLLPLIPLLAAAILLRARAAGVVVLLVGLPFMAYYAPLFLPHPKSSAPASLTVMTHNILVSNRDAEQLAQNIRANAPDVIALQELTPAMASRLQPLLASEYPYRLINGAQGLGLYSRYPIRGASVLTLGPENSFAQRVTLDTPDGPLTVYNAHPRNPDITWGKWRGRWPYVVDFDPTRRDLAVNHLADLVAREHGPLLIVGDLNLSEHNAAYARLTSSLRDAHREAGHGLGATFPVAPVDSIRLPFPVIRIDYVLYSSDFQAIDSYNANAAGSDHRPVVARLSRTAYLS